MGQGQGGGLGTKWRAVLLFQAGAGGGEDKGFLLLFTSPYSRPSPPRPSLGPARPSPHPPPAPPSVAATGPAGAATDAGDTADVPFLLPATVQRKD